MKICVEAYGAKYIIEQKHDDQSEEEMEDILTSLMHALTYNPSKRMYYEEREEE